MDCNSERKDIIKTLLLVLSFVGGTALLFYSNINATVAMSAYFVIYILSILFLVILYLTTRLDNYLMLSAVLLFVFTVSLPLISGILKSLGGINLIVSLLVAIVLSLVLSYVVSRKLIN